MSGITTNNCDRIKPKIMKNIKILFLIISILSLSLPGYSQILYTDLIPDTTVMVTSEDTVAVCFQIDINQDSVPDFTLCNLHHYEFHTAACCHFFTNWIAAIDTNSKIAGGSDLCTTAGLDSGALIDNNFLWNSFTYLNYQNAYYGCVQPPSPKFYPVKLFKNGNYYFGWLRIYSDGIVNFYSTITLFDMAINLTPNQSISAGQMTTGIAGNNQDLNVLNTFPNPSNGSFSIQIPEQSNKEKKWTLVIFNNLGTMVRKIPVDSNQTRISVSLVNESKGIYHCLLFNGVNSYHVKSIVQ